MSEQSKTMSIVELADQTTSLAGAVAGMHNLFVGVSQHLNLLNEVVGRLYKENQELHQKLSLAISTTTPAPAIVETEHGWPISLCVVGRVIMESIQKGMSEGLFRMATFGNLDTVAEKLSYNPDVIWPVIPVADVPRKNTIGVFNYGVLTLGNERKGYTFALCLANMPSDDLVFEIGISYRVIEIWAHVTNSQGARGKVSISPDAFANLLDEYMSGNYCAVHDVINSFELDSVPEIKHQVPQAAPVAEPVPEPAVPSAEQPAPNVNDKSVLAMIDELVQKHHQKEGVIRTYQQSIVNVNKNEPSYWDRTAVIYYNTGNYALGNGEVLVRVKLNDLEDLVILWHYINGKNTFGYFRVDQTKAHAAACDLATVVELLKSVQ